MAASLGSLVVSLGLDAAQFTTGLTKSEADIRRFSQSLSNQIAVGIIKAEIALRALGEAFTFVVRSVPDLAKQAGHFQDLAEKTGASAEAMAGFAIALKITDKSADDLGDFMVRLSKSLVGVEDGTERAGSALLALRINIKEFKALDPAAQIDALSKALARFSDFGGGKAAVLESLGKGAANLLPFLKELNEQGGRNTILTAEQIKMADAFSDAQARAAGQLNAYAQVAGIKTLQAVTALTGATKEFVKELIGLEGKSNDLAGSNAIENWADRGARAVAFIVDAVQGVGRAFQVTGLIIASGAAQMQAISSGELSRVLSIAKDAKKEIDDILEGELFSAKLERQIAGRGKAPAGAAGADRPQLSFGGPPKPGSDATKGILDGQIKAFEASIAREKDILNARADYLQDYFRDGLLSVSDYYSKLQQARDNELQNVLRFYDLEIAAANQAKAKAKNAVERQDFTNKIVDIQAKQANILRDSFNAEEKLTRERNRATLEYADQLDELNAKMLELAGNTAAAAAIRFDAQNRVLINSLKATGDTGAVAQTESLKAQQVAIANVNDLTRRYSLTLGEVSIAQAKIDLLASTGAITEIDAINRRSQIALQYVGILRQQADAAEVAANKLQGMDKLFALQNVARFRFEIDALAASTDVLAKKFNDIFSSGFTNFLTDIISGTKSVKQAFLDMGKSIEQQISKIASQNIAESLFGKGGQLGGIGEFFSSLFGGKGPAANATGAAESASIAALGTAASTTAGLVTSTDAPLITLTASLAAAALATDALAASMLAASAASAASAGAKIGTFAEAIAAAVASGGSFAGGGSPPVGKLSFVGEQGPELFLPRQAGTIIPLDAFRNSNAGKSVHIGAIHINVPQGTSRASADQIGLAAARAAQRSLGKLG